MTRSSVRFVAAGAWAAAVGSARADETVAIPSFHPPQGVTLELRLDAVGDVPSPAEFK